MLHFKRKLNITLLCLIGSLLVAREKININNGWKYIENSSYEINEQRKSIVHSLVNLPHTWNQWDVLDVEPGYRRSASWYRKKLFIPKRKNSTYKLYFEGSNITTTVYINNVQAGHHIGGYVPFHIDITKFIKPGKQNDIDIRVDNSYNPNIIPSQKADFFIYGGITRDLWLEIYPKTHISRCHITPHDINKEQASTRLEISFENASILTNGQLDISIFEKLTNQKILNQKQNIDLNKTNVIELNKLLNPKLWSPNNPNLYRIEVNLLSNSKLIDTYIDILGYRWYEFNNDGAFLLNGERLLLRGTHRHEDHAGLGQAMSNDQQKKDIADIKNMGANFIRLAHYPQDPSVYQACDELGLIVWDELPWCRGGVGSASWQTNTKRLLEEQIDALYNHPSIFFWSLGNEMYWLPDFEGGDNPITINKFLLELQNVVDHKDPIRLTAIRKYAEGSSIVDIFSPSIWSGWYAGLYYNYQDAITKNQKQYKNMLHMEYGGNSLIGRHKMEPYDGKGNISNDPTWTEVANQVGVVNVAKYGDQSESYITDLFDWYLNVSEQQPNFAGNAQWAYKDFATPLRPEENIPFMNLKGVVDREGRPKDAYYVFKSYWAKKPFNYIQSHTWDYRVNSENKNNLVRVYANTEEVELFLNNVSLGKKQKQKNVLPAGGLVWDVPFVEGNNKLSSIGYIEGKKVAEDDMKLYYTSKPHGRAEEIQLSYKINSKGQYLIEALAVDKDKQRVTDYEKRIYFSLDGNGKLLNNYGTYDKSKTIEMANGKAVILLEPDATGICTIEARNHDFKGNYITIDFSNKTITSIK